MMRTKRGGPDTTSNLTHARCIYQSWR